MLLDARFPFTEDSLEPAFLAAGAVCEGEETIVHAVQRIVMASAPQVGAAALLDFADDLCPVGVDLPADRSARLAYELATQLRARAHKLADWDRTDEQATSSPVVPLRIAAS